MSRERARQHAIFTLATIQTYPWDEVMECSWIDIKDDDTVVSTSNDFMVHFKIVSEFDVEVLEFKDLSSTD